MTRNTPHGGLLLWSALACAVLACAPGPTLVRFENRAPIWRVADRRPIPKPAEVEFSGYREDIEAFVRAPVLHALAIPEARLAENVNALGEVPDSTWFTNRIGRHAWSPAEVARGPGGSGPDRTAPWTIRSRKGGGTAPGFVIEDARGDRYILKFDPLTAPAEAETAAEAIVARLLWAAGYNVPENHVVTFERGDLRLAEDAVQSLPFGGKAPLGAADVDATLSDMPRTSDGHRWRAVASKYLEGIPIGGFPITGVRADDPNDRVPHERRRDVRGQNVFFAWLGHTDVKQSNTLDMWVPQAPGAPHGVVVHHLLDFGKALGTWGRDGRHEHDGYAPHFDYGYAMTSFARFGLWRRPWEGVEAPEIRGVGRFESQHFDPGRYAPATPYPPFFEADRLDAYWAAKIIARFERAHLEAAVAQGRLSDPRAAPYLVRVLDERRQKILRHWFALVNPVDDFEVFEQEHGVRLCAVDLALRYGVASATRSRHRWRAFDENAGALAWSRQPWSGAEGRLCADGLPLSEEGAGHALLAMRTWRQNALLPDVIVHLARDPKTGAPQIIGVERR